MSAHARRNLDLDLDTSGESQYLHDLTTQRSDIRRWRRPSWREGVAVGDEAAPVTSRLPASEGGLPMKRSVDRMLTSHVGSLPRPPELLEAVAALGSAENGKANDAQHAYERVLRKDVAELVRRQAKVGIDIVSDGELGKASWATYILDRVSGFEIRRDR